MDRSDIFAADSLSQTASYGTVVEDTPCHQAKTKEWIQPETLVLPLRGQHTLAGALAESPGAVFPV
ncbi:MAG: hypothetical protein NVSMB28_33260 [Collimonas sp.]